MPVVTSEFEETVRLICKTNGVPESAVVVIPHPFVALSPADVGLRAAAAVARIVSALAAA